jgi:hypothetical protein
MSLRLGGQCIEKDIEDSPNQVQKRLHGSILLAIEVGPFETNETFADHRSRENMAVWLSSSPIRIQTVVISFRNVEETASERGRLVSPPRSGGENLNGPMDRGRSFPQNAVDHRIFPRDSTCAADGFSTGLYVRNPADTTGLCVRSSYYPVEKHVVFSNPVAGTRKRHFP